MTSTAAANAAARGVLVAIVESTDSAVTANERLRAIELLRQMGGDDDGALALAAWISGLDDDQIAPTLAALVGSVPAVAEAEREAELQRRLTERLPAEVDRLAEELRAEVEQRLAALRAEDERRLQERARELAEALYAERVERDSRGERSIP